MQNEQYINHEVRVQLLEKLVERFDARFDHIDNKMDSHFKWMLSSILGLGLVLTTFLGAIALHAMKLT